MRQKRSPSCTRRSPRTGKQRQSVRQGEGLAACSPVAHTRGDARVRRALEVQMTSRKCRFIHVSQLTRLPLYVSPFFSSTNWCG